jgi:dihydrofolate reductase
VLSHYIASSLLGLIAWWLEEERPFSVTQMDEYFRQLTMQGTAQVMGITPQMVS